MNTNTVARASHRVAGVTHVRRIEPFDGRDSIATMNQSAMTMTGPMADGSAGGSPSGTRVNRLLILTVFEKARLSIPPNAPPGWPNPQLPASAIELAIVVDII